jgi:hypothetical protein
MRIGDGHATIMTNVRRKLDHDLALEELIYAAPTGTKILGLRGRDRGLCLGLEVEVLTESHAMIVVRQDSGQEMTRHKSPDVVEITGRSQGQDRDQCHGVRSRLLIQRVDAMVMTGTLIVRFVIQTGHLLRWKSLMKEYVFLWLILLRMC